MGMLKQAAGEQPAQKPTTMVEEPYAGESPAPAPAPENEGTEEAPAESAPGGTEPDAEGEPVAQEAQNGGEEQATPEEQAQYERAFRALNKIMYTDQKSSQAVFDMLQPEDKVGSVSRAAIMLVKMIDDKLDMPETIISEITKDAVEQLVDLAERGKQMALSDQEQEQAMGATWEGVLEVFGQPVEEMRQFAQANQKEAQKGMGQVQSAFNGQPGGSAERRRMPAQGA